MNIDIARRFLFLDGSGTSTWDDCPTRAWFNYVAGGKGWVPLVDSPPLVAGNAVHAGLATRYRREGNKPPTFETIAAMYDAAKAVFAKATLPPDNWRTEEEVCKLFDAYNAFYEAEPFAVLEAETPFARAIGTLTVAGQEWRIGWQGKRDMSVRFLGSSSALWVFDHKTDSQECNLVRKWGQNRSQLGYVWSQQQRTGIKPEGFYMNILRWREPLGPPKLKKDGTPRKQRDDTKPRHEFFRIPLPVAQWQLDEWREGVMASADAFLQALTRGVWPKSAKDCCFCPYHEPCTVAPAQRERIIANMDFKVNDWSPLKEDGPETA